jgi:hypothetical protein
MASKVPTASRVNWAAVGLQLLVLVSLMVSLGSLGLDPMIGPVIYLSWSWGTKLWLARDHRRSIGLIKAGRYAEAIPHCEASAAWFEQRSWVDRYRAVVMLSSSAWSYREMALANRAFCLGLSGRGQEAMRAYEDMLLEFPESALAGPALTMMRAAQQA